MVDVFAAPKFASDTVNYEDVRVFTEYLLVLNQLMQEKPTQTVEIDQLELCYDRKWHEDHLTDRVRMTSDNTHHSFTDGP